VHARLLRNERLAIERLQQTDFGACQDPLLHKGPKRTLKKHPAQLQHGEEEEEVTPATR
jgi:hypothetical protein